MLTREQNEFLTQVGPGTPAGELLRRYWQPVGVHADFPEGKTKKQVRILGEDLVLYKTGTDEDGNDTYALIQEHCAHRAASLYYGFVEGDNIRCPYHGWLYDKGGNCLEQPFEQDNRRFKERVRMRAYPVRTWRGMIFAYMGPEPAPVLPKWDVLRRRDGKFELLVEPVLNCNWLQPMENSVDTVHTFYLHGHTFKTMGLPGGEYYYRKIEKFDFELMDWGIVKRRFYATGPGDDAGEQEKGHPLVFPNMLRVPEGPRQAFHWRVPVDDERTMVYWAGIRPNADGTEEPWDDKPPVTYVDGMMSPEGEHNMLSFRSQDRMAWETQGVITDRTTENLGAEDKGIAMYRRLLREQIEIVQQGGEPMALIRDERDQYVDFETSTGQAHAEYARTREDWAPV